MVPPATTSTPRVAVIGGGFSGLAAAHRLSELARESERPVEVTLFEAGSRVGGLVGTKRIGDYLVETGADSFITKKPWALELCKRLGLESRLLSTDPTYQRSLVLRDGRPVRVPEGFLLLAPTRFGSVLKSPLFSLPGKLRMGLECCVPRRKNESDESLASFVRRRFGREAFERLVQPLVGGIYTADPEKLSLQAAFPQFAGMEREHGSLIRALRKQAGQLRPEERASSGARFGMFVAPAEGMSELIERLSARVRQRTTVRLETPVAAVEPLSGNATPDQEAARRWQLKLRDGTHEMFDAVILALPAYRAAELLRECDDLLAEALRGIRYASSAIVVTGHRLADVRHPLDAFGLVIPAIEKRRILAVSFASRKFPGRAQEGRVILRTFVGGALQPEMVAHSDEKLLQIVREELGDILGVSGEADFGIVSRYPDAMPQYHLGHLDRVQRIEQRAAGHPGLELAGNAYRGVGIPDAVHSGEQAAERTVKALMTKDQ